MRWKKWFGSLALAAAAAAGCKQQIYMTPDDLQGTQELALTRPLESDPSVSYTVDNTALVPPPPTATDPERPARYMTLAEAIALSLEHGTIGSQGLNGINNDNLVSFFGRSVSGSDAVRVLALDPAIVGADMEASLAKFDAQWNTSMTWSNTDTPIASALQSFQASSSGQITAIQQEQATLSTSLLKPLPTGGVAGITFATPYSFSNLASRVNPSYTPTLQFQFEQPLLQGFGIEINQLRASHPGSLLTPFPTGGRVEGILITRIRFDQQRAEFERQVHTMLVNVETAYWNLYASYWNLYAREQGLKIAFEVWVKTKAKFDVGSANIIDLAQIRSQYEQFRSQRLAAVDQILENERRLRALLGLPIEDGKRLLPADAPTLSLIESEWDAAQRDALELRPELVLARKDLKFQQLNLIAQKDLTRPDLRLTSRYTISGIGSQLDGPGGNNAFRSLAGDHFNNFDLGLNMSVALGYRDANSAVRAARLNLLRSYNSLQDQERKALQFLALQRRQLVTTYRQIAIQRSIREANEGGLKALLEKILVGSTTVDLIFLDSLRQYADALSSEYSFIAQYNSTLASWEFAKGTIMTRDNVLIGEGPLPNCVQKRAVEHEEERLNGLILRERANPVDYQQVGSKDCDLKLPQLSRYEAPPLASLFEKAPKPPVDKSGNVLPLPSVTPTADAKSVAEDKPSPAPTEPRPSTFRSFIDRKAKSGSVDLESIKSDKTSPIGDQ